MRATSTPHHDEAPSSSISSPGPSSPPRARGLRRLLPRRADYAGLRQTWRGDVLAGLTVGVVALPLALAFGVTTGLGAAAGITTAIVAGVVAAVFGGSDVQVSGPTGAMTVVLVPLVASYGAEAVVVVGVLAGLLVVAAGVLRAGRLLAYVPWPVVVGFTLGIAVIIFLQQVPAALGVVTPEGDRTALVAVQAVGAALTSGNGAAIGVVVLVVVVMVGTLRLHPALPSSLLAVGVATAVTWGFGLDVTTIGALPSALPSPTWPSFALGDLGPYLSAAVAVAVLAAVESLLSAKVADGMVGDGVVERPAHDPDRELFGQGLANVASSLLGGMPATGAIARTAVNVRAGARTRVASLVHSAVLVLVVVAGSGLVAHVPLAALAGVLMVTAVRMVQVAEVRAVLGATRPDAVVLGATAVVTVALDLIVAIEVGLLVAGVLALRAVARSTVVTTHAVLADPAGEGERAEPAPLVEGTVGARAQIVTYHVDGALFFGAAERLAATLSAAPEAGVVILRLPDLQVLDATGAQALGQVVAGLEARGTTVLVKGLRSEHARTLRAVGALEGVVAAGHLFDHLDDALAHARSHVGDPGR